MVNWGNIATGAGTGALTGAGALSPLGPIGAGIGAAGGALIGGYGASRQKKGGLLNTPEETANVNRFTPEQQAYLNQILAVLSGTQEPTGILGQALSTEALEAPYKRQFQEEIIPQLAEKYAGIGAGSQSSSAFQQALGKSAADLSERLAYLNAQQKQSLFSLLSQLGLTPQYNQYYQPSGPSALAQGLGALAGGFGEAAGQYLGSKWASPKQPTGSTINSQGQITGSYYG